MFKVKARLDELGTIGLRHAIVHLLRHIGRRVANVDLTAGEVVFAPVERE